MSCQGKMNEVNAPRVSSFDAAASSCMCHSSGITAPHHGRWWMDKTKPKSKHNPKDPSKVRKGDAKEEEEPTHVHHTGNVFQSVLGCWMYVGEIRKTEDSLVVA